MQRTATQRRANVAQRSLLWVVIVVCAAATGLFWAAHRQARAVDATVRTAITAEMATDGTLVVEEEVVVVDAGRRVIQRVVPALAGLRWGGIVGSDGEAVDHTTVQVPEGLQVSVPLDDDPAVLRLRYEVFGAGQAAMDAVELAWPVLDDRNPLAIASLELDVSWSGTGEPAAIEVEAPGTSTTIVPRPGGVRVETGALPAHQLTEIHAALPSDAVRGMAPQNRSVMDAMGTDDLRGRAGGGPWWLPLVVAMVVLTGWAALRRRHGQQPDPDVVVVTQPPGNEPPAEVAWLLRNGVVREEDIAATLIDLVSRSVIAVEQDRWEVLPHAQDALAPHEAVLINWVFADGRTCEPGQLVDRVTRDPAGWRLMRREFIEAVEQEGREDGFLERTLDAESVVGVGVAGAAVVVAGVIGTALGQLLWLLCIAVGALVVTSLDAFARRSPEGAHRASAWLAFGDHLEQSPVVPDVHRAMGIVLQVPAAHDETTRQVAQRVDDLAHAYVTATSYLAPPRRRRTMTMS